MSAAPHLPPKSCDIKLHTRLLALPGFLLLVGIAVLAGFAAALATVAWVAPPFYTDQFLSAIDGGRAAENETLDPVVGNGIRQRTVGIFDTTKKVQGASVYPESSFVTYAALLSSDGWAVLSDAAYRPGKEKQWEGVDIQGVRHRVERAIADPVAGLVYIKLSGDGFRVFPFPDWRAVEPGASLWHVDITRPMTRSLASKRVSVRESARRTTDASYPIWRPEYIYRLERTATPGALVTTYAGELVGFVDKSGGLIPGWLVAGQLSSVLSSRPIRYDRAPWEGYMAHGVAREDIVQFVPGFFIQSGAQGGLQRGDILIRVEGESIDPAHLSRYLLLAPAEFSVTVIRGGEEMNVTITP